MTGLLGGQAELETCYSLSGRVEARAVPGPVWPGPETRPPPPPPPGPLPRPAPDRCFDIRHQRHTGSSRRQERAGRSEEGSESDPQDPDPGYSDGGGAEDAAASRSKEDMDRVIAELTSALIQSKGVSALTNAVSRTGTGAEKKTNKSPPQHTKHQRSARSPQQHTSHTKE